MIHLIYITIILLVGLLCYMDGFQKAMPHLTAKNFSVDERFILLKLESLCCFDGWKYKYIAVIQSQDPNYQERTFIIKGDDFALEKIGSEFIVTDSCNWRRFTRYPEETIASN